jgi:hypothetical protein
VDQTLEMGGILGVSLAYDSVSTDTATSSATASSVTLQPYLAIQMGDLDAVVSLAYGMTDYATYTTGATSGTADGRNLEVALHLGRTFELAADRSVRPYLDVALGRASLSFDGDLAGTSDAAFNTRRAAVGVEVAQALTAKGLLPGSALHGRVEIGHASHTGPATSFAVTNAADNRNTGTLAIGGTFVTSNQSTLRIEAVASGLGGVNRDVGLSGNLAIRF